MKILINPKYEHLRPFVERLVSPIFFARHGKTLHSGRNIARSEEACGSSSRVTNASRRSIASPTACSIGRPPNVRWRSSEFCTNVWI